MPRTPDDDDDDFSPADYGWTEEEWDELLDLYGFDDYDELLDAYPELEDFGEWMDELDYLGELDHLTDDDDFYG